MWRTDNEVIGGKQGGYFRSLDDDGLNGMVVAAVVMVVAVAVAVAVAVCVCVCVCVFWGWGWGSRKG